jgi:cell division septum initiation protein DivIVA
MDVTIELLDNAAFREAKKGYSTQDVDEFIEQVKDGVQRSEAHRADLQRRVEVAEERALEAERRAREAAEQASGTSEMDETLKRTLVLAQRTADAAVKEAEEQASRTLSSAQDQAARMLADAKEVTARARADAEREAMRAHEEARTRVLDELHELEAQRDQLRSDVDLLESHAGEQRDRVRFAASELQRLLDDPGALRPSPAPDISDVTVEEAVEPAPSGLDPLPRRLEAAPEPEAAAPEPAAGDIDLTDDESLWPETAEPEPEPEREPEPEPVPVADADDGPPTQAVDVLAQRDDADDDAYLAELRKAMTDESPLGPREGDDIDSLFDTSNEPPRSRFGRRR